MPDRKFPPGEVPDVFFTRAEDQEGDPLEKWLADTLDVKGPNTRESVASKRFRISIDLEVAGATMDDAVRSMADALARDVEVQTTLRVREFHAAEGRYPRFAWYDHPRPPLWARGMQWSPPKSLNLSVTVEVGDVLPEDGHGRTVFHLDSLNSNPAAEEWFRTYAAILLEENEG